MQAVWNWITGKINPDKVLTVKQLYTDQKYEECVTYILYYQIKDDEFVNNPDVWYIMAKAYEEIRKRGGGERGSREKVMDCLQMAVRCSHVHGVYAEELASMYLDEKKYEEGWKFFQKNMDRNVLEFVVFCMYCKKYQEAMQCLEKAIEKTPENVEYRKARVNVATVMDTHIHSEDIHLESSSPMMTKIDRAAPVYQEKRRIPRTNRKKPKKFQDEF